MAIFEITATVEVDMQQNPAFNYAAREMTGAKVLRREIESWLEDLDIRTIKLRVLTYAAEAEDKGD